MYPWLSEPIAQLATLIRRRQLSHALLFKGIGGLGKRELARVGAQMLLCQSTDMQALTPEPTHTLPCGQCHGCQLVLAGTHSDLHIISGDGRSIGVDTIRALSQVLSDSARLGQGKVAIIEQADKMTEAAANALLKTLEEPAGRATLILTSSHAERLLPTIHSRCQQWLIPVPAATWVLPWLTEKNIPLTDTQTQISALNINQGSPLNTQAYLLAGHDQQRHTLLQQFTELKVQPQKLAELHQGLLAQPIHFIWLQLLLQDALQLALGLTPASLRLTDSQVYSQALSLRGTQCLESALTGLLQLQKTLQAGQGRPVNAGVQLSIWLNTWLTEP